MNCFKLSGLAKASKFFIISPSIVCLTANSTSLPFFVFGISEIPKTKNGKLVELAVKQTIEGEKIKNLEALANPDSLKQFENIKELNE